MPTIWTSQTTRKTRTTIDARDARRAPAPRSDGSRPREVVVTETIRVVTRPAPREERRRPADEPAQCSRGSSGAGAARFVGTERSSARTGTNALLAERRTAAPERAGEPARLDRRRQDIEDLAGAL